VLAKNGYRVLHINDTGVIKYDAYVNDIASELKRLSSENNIENEAKDAIHVKKAKLVVFEFEKETRAIYKELDNLVKVKIHGMYWFKKRESKIYSF
jgi:hypothetical protein